MLSGLEWSRPISDGDWDEAMALCAELTHDGVSGWRLPTKDELLGAYEHGIGKAATANWITAEDINRWWFWSSSPVPSAPSNAWYVNLAYGATDDDHKDYRKQVACVR